MKKTKVTIKKRELFEIREGLTMLKGIKSVKLGVARTEIVQIITPPIEALQEGYKNEAFELMIQEEQRILVTYADDIARRSAELSALHRKQAGLIKERDKQNAEYEKILDEPIELSISLLPISFLPEKEVPNEAIEKLMKVIDFKG